VLFGFFSGSDATGVQYGDLLMDFELELIDRTPDYGFTVSVADLKAMKTMFYQQVLNVCSNDASCTVCDVRRGNVSDEDSDDKEPPYRGAAAVAGQGAKSKAPCEWCSAEGVRVDAYDALKRYEAAMSKIAATRLMKEVEYVQAAHKDLGFLGSVNGWRGGARAMRDLMCRAGLGDTPNTKPPMMRIADRNANMFAAANAVAVDASGNIGVLQSGGVGATLSNPMFVAQSLKLPNATRVEIATQPNSANTLGAPVVAPAGTNSDGSQFALHTSNPVGSVMVATATSLSLSDAKEDVVIVDTPQGLAARKALVKKK